MPAKNIYTKKSQLRTSFLKAKRCYHYEQLEKSNLPVWKTAQLHFYHIQASHLSMSCVRFVLCHLYSTYHHQTGRCEMCLSTTTKKSTKSKKKKEFSIFAAIKLINELKTIIEINNKWQISKLRVRIYLERSGNPDCGFRIDGNKRT